MLLDRCTTRPHACSYRDDEVDLVQSHAIMRYLGRKHDMCVLGWVAGAPPPPQ